MTWCGFGLGFTLKTAHAYKQWFRVPACCGVAGMPVILLRKTGWCSEWNGYSHLLSDVGLFRSKRNWFSSQFSTRKMKKKFLRDSKLSSITIRTNDTFWDHMVNIFNESKTKPTPNICCLHQENPKAIMSELYKCKIGVWGWPGVNRLFSTMVLSNVSACSSGLAPQGLD